MISPEGGIGYPLGEDRSVSPTSRCVEIVVLNKAVLQIVSLDCILAGAEDVVVDDLSPLQATEKDAITHIAVNAIFATTNDDVVRCDY